MEEIGDNADPRAFAQVLRDISNRVARDFTTTFEVKTKQPYEGDLGLGVLDVSPPSSEVQQYIDAGLSPEEAKELAELEAQLR